MNICLENKYEIDKHNDRIVSYIVDEPGVSVEHISKLEHNHKSSKSIIYTLPEHIETFRKHGYHTEGKISGFFQGRDGHILTKYQMLSRKEESTFEKNQEILEVARNDRKQISETELETGFELIEATEEDARSLAGLYQKVFQYYPTDVHNPDYLKKVISQDYFFVIIKYNGKVVSAASAMVFPEYNSAEITDCATDPEFRGKNLMYSVILKLEKRLKQKGVKTLFSLTRAQSYGMNLTVKRLGYQYEGTLINNCVIFSGYEDMNIWSKMV